MKFYSPAYLISTFFGINEVNRAYSITKKPICIKGFRAFESYLLQAFLTLKFNIREKLLLRPKFLKEIVLKKLLNLLK